MNSRVRDQTGAALLTTLLFVVIMFILVVTMLAVAGNESAISGLHRDSVRAKEVAEAGLSEAIQRIEQGHPYALASASYCYNTDPTMAGPPYFENSLAPGGSARVRVCLQEAGVGGAVLEIQSNATVGVARRRLSLIAVQQALQLLPDLVFGHDCASGGSADIAGGDVYCQTYVKLKTATDGLVYAGWRASKLSPNSIPPCYSRQDCLSQAGLTEAQCAANPGADPRCLWYPGHRRAMYKGIPINSQLEQGNDTRTLNGVFNYTCPATLDSDKPLQDIQSLMGHPRADDTVSNSPDIPAGTYQATDLRQDNQPMPATTPLYGCTKDGMPYTWVREAFDSDDPDSVADKFMWFKVIEFERWRDAYWIFCFGQDNPPDAPECDTATGPSYEKRQLLAEQPWRGAVPPFPDFNTLAGSAQQTVTGGGTLTGADSINWGCKYPEMSCPGGVSEPRSILLTGGDYRINANIQAHGTILVGPNQDLEINGTFTCWCVLVIDGNLTLGNGTVTIHGGLVAKNTAELSGNITVYAGNSIASIPVGLSSVTAISWWQR